KTRFGVPEITLAVIPGSGGTQLLPRLVGLSKAKWMLLSGQSVKSQEALEMGLIDRVAAEGNLLKEAMEMGDTVAANGPLAYAAIKQSLRNGMEMPFSEAMLEESKLFAKLADTEDKAEGVLAFLEKRKPEFKGK
ncbi:enoyl-CoA hydratase/isomerase family protein, partial [Thermodesulfobacteriota bacterium]